MSAEATLVAIADVSAADPADRLATLFDAHHGRLYRLARRMSRTGEEACDLVQETFLRAARTPATIPTGAPHEEAWLVRVLINICRDRWRRQATRARLHARYEFPAMRHVDAESALMARSVIWDALGALAPRRRAVIVMYELEGTAIPTIARMLGVSAVTVRWHLSMGRRELARHVRGGNKGDES